jgi:hypothetical protein
MNIVFKAIALNVGGCCRYGDWGWSTGAADAAQTLESLERALRAEVRQQAQALG